MARLLKRRDFNSQNKFLLLDRDGVINVERKNYVLRHTEFVFKSDFISNAKFINNYFNTVLVVTNQSCIGRGLLSVEELKDIHNIMTEKSLSFGLKIDKIYFSSGLDETDARRKPNTGMINDILHDFPSFNFDSAIMIGNRKSDMQFGKKLGIKSVHYTDRGTEDKVDSALVDAIMSDWYEFNALMRELKINEG